MEQLADLARLTIERVQKTLGHDFQADYDMSVTRLATTKWNGTPSC